MPEADETIITRFVVEAEKAIEETARFRSQIDTIKTQIIATSKATKQSFDVVATSIKRVKIKEFTDEITRLKDKIKEIQSQKGVISPRDQSLLVQYKDSLQRVNREMREFKEASSRALAEVKQGAGGVQGFIANLTNLGNVGKYVFGTVLGIGAVQALRQATRAFLDFAKEILRRGTEMTEVIFTLEVAIRGLQRMGLDTTIASWTEQIQKLKKEFPFFPKREFMEGASLAALMTREFGFTADQIGEIVRMSAILAQITGKDLLESVRGITFAIGSGYFESLQRAGVNISRAVVKNEALAQGYEGVYNELEPTIRASVTYSVIQKNLAAIQEDASRKVETFAGQVQILTSRMEDLKNLFGETVTASDSLIGTLETLNELLGEIQRIYDALAGLDVDIFAPMRAFLGLDKIIRDIEALTASLKALANAIEALGKVSGVLRQLAGALATVSRAFGFEDFANTLEDVEELLFNIHRSLGNLAEQEEVDIPIKVGGVEFTAEEYQEILDATRELQEGIVDIEEDAVKKRIDIMEDWARDTARLRQKHDQKMEDLAEDHQRKLDDIELKAEQRRADEFANYQFRVAEAIRQANFRREDAERKYRERELKEEKRFQEKLRQLRENFLLDLEDAVRERDALQIIRLTRQYNLRRKQMIREEKLSKDDRQDALQEELRQIERQRQERLRQLAVEHERRLQAIDLQAQRERDRAELEFQRRQAAEKLRAEQQRQDREDRRDEQLTDLEQATKDRIAKVLEGLQEEYGLTQRQLEAVGDLWKSYYGVGGVITTYVDQGVDYTITRMTQLLDWMNTIRSQWMQRMTFTPPGFTPPGFAGGQAKGGTIIARKPTVAIFGEAGPEMAQFTPLNRLGANAPAQIKPMDIDQMTRDGRIRLEMLLSPDLEARIVDNTLGEIADVNFTIERARK